MSTRQQVLDTTFALTDLALSLLIAAQAASDIVRMAQEQGWADSDPRWAEAWKDADAAYKAVRDKL